MTDRVSPVPTNQAKKPARRVSILQHRVLPLMALLFIAVTVSAISSPYFLTPENLQVLITAFFVELAIVAIGQTLVILVRGIDLSVGGNLALSAITVGYFYKQGTDIYVAMGLGLLVGLTCGFLNGMLVTLFRTPAMIATLATGLLFNGIAQGITSGRPFSSFPDSYQALGQGFLGPIPVQLMILLVLAVLTHTILTHTRFGRQVYAIGGNPLAAKFSGIHTNRVTMLMYMGSGLMAAIAGIVASARLLAAGPLLSTGVELGSITAVLLGGVSVAGGEGTVFEALVGMLVIAVIRSGMTLAGVTQTIQLTTVALVLLGICIVNLRLARIRV